MIENEEARNETLQLIIERYLESGDLNLEFCLSPEMLELIEKELIKNDEAN